MAEAEIECTVCTFDALQTELAEIDENVVRTELSVIEYGELLERRKEISESLQDTAGKLDVSSRTAERTVQMMKGLTEDMREVFRHSPKYKLRQSNTMKLSRMEPGKQKTAAILLVSGQIRSADDYRPIEVRAAPGHTKSSRQQKLNFWRVSRN